MKREFNYRAGWNLIPIFFGLTGMFFSMGLLGWELVSLVTGKPMLDSDGDVVPSNLLGTIIFGVLFGVMGVRYLFSFFSEKITVTKDAVIWRTWIGEEFVFVGGEYKDKVRIFIFPVRTLEGITLVRFHSGQKVTMIPGLREVGTKKHVSKNEIIEILKTLGDDPAIK